MPHIQEQRRSCIKMVGGAQSCYYQTPYLPETLRGHKQNLMYTRTQRKGHWSTQETEPDLPECLSFSCGGVGQQWPATGTGVLAAAVLGGTTCGIHPLGGGHHEPYQVGDPQTGGQLYQRSSHTIAKILGSTIDFPTWGSGNGTENPQEIWLWRSEGFDYRTSRGLGKQTLGGYKQNLVHTRTQGKGSVAPQETEPDLPVSVLESPVESWVDSGLLWGQGHWQQQSCEARSVGISPLEGGCHSPTTEPIALP